MYCESLFTLKPGGQVSEFFFILFYFYFLAFFDSETSHSVYSYKVKRSFRIKSFSAFKVKFMYCLMESLNLRARRDISWRNWGSGWGSDLFGAIQPGRSKAGTGIQMCLTLPHLILLYFSETTCLSFGKLLYFQASCPRRVSCFTSKAISSPEAPAKHLALDRDVPCFPLSAGCWRGWVRNYALIPSSQAECK